MITIAQLEKLEEDWINDRRGKLHEIKSVVESIEKDSVATSIWQKARELQERIALYENTEVPYQPPRERPYGGLSWPGDDDYDICSSWP